ncbi:MAG TPA: DUF1499 domain-containing protein [Nevskiaceae bacterium]|nr:DUF1499 domain-containing protein [Nevskiaceae bacterium]
MSRTAAAVLISGFAVMLAACGSAPQLRSGDGRLAPCGDPNCVSSQDADPARRVEPIRYEGTREGAQQLLASIISRTEGAQIVDNQPGYIHATYTSKVLGFVADVELVFPPQKFVDVRSASRTGYYDFDVNRKRVEDLRKAFNDRQP